MPSERLRVVLAKAGSSRPAGGEVTERSQVGAAAVAGGLAGRGQLDPEAILALRQGSGRWRPGAVLRADGGRRFGPWSGARAIFRPFRVLSYRRGGFRAALRLLGRFRGGIGGVPTSRLGRIGSGRLLGLLLGVFLRGPGGEVQAGGGLGPVQVAEPEVDNGPARDGNGSALDSRVGGGLGLVYTGQCAALGPVPAGLRGRARPGFVGSGRRPVSGGSGGDLQGDAQGGRGRRRRRRRGGSTRTGCGPRPALER